MKYSRNALITSVKLVVELWAYTKSSCISVVAGKARHVTKVNNRYTVNVIELIE